MPRVSVCIPTYNAAPYIGKTIQSVLGSTYTDFEVIISDDASTDRTREIVKAFSDDRIRLFTHSNNLGAPGNWNRALEKSSGELVGLLNHDDLYGPFWLAWAVRALEKNPDVGWASTAYHIVDEKGKPLGTIRRFPQSGVITRGEAFACIAKLDGLGPAYLVRREILERVGGYDETLGPGADNELFLRLAARHPLHYSGNPHHAAWRLHRTNLTHRWGTVAQAIEGLKALRKTFDDDALPLELRAHERASYRYFYQKILARAREHQERGAAETARRLVQLLRADQQQRFPSSPLIHEHLLPGLD